MKGEEQLTRRERQIMGIVYSLGEATVHDLHQRLDSAPAHSAIRTMLKILEDKGQLKRRKRGREYVYSPNASRTHAGKSAMRRVIDTFFGGRLEDAVGAHLADRKGRLSEEELNRLAELIEEARQKEE